MAKSVNASLMGRGPRGSASSIDGQSVGAGSSSTVNLVERINKAQTRNSNLVGESPLLSTELPIVKMSDRKTGKIS